MRAAVYNRFWHSRGGGERHAGMIAQVLSLPVSEGGCGVEEVELLGHTEQDLADLGAHLGLNLTRCRYRLLPDRGDAALAEVSEEYDFWLTASYMSRLAPRATRSAYLCWFPTPFDHDLATWRRTLVRLVGPALRGDRSVTFGSGWYPPEGGRRRRWVWTSGDGVLAVPPGQNRRLRADLGRPGAPGSTALRVEDLSGRVLHSLPVEPRFRRHSLNLGSSVRGSEIRFRSDAFSPAAQPGQPDDIRELGVALSRAWLRTDKASLRAWASARFPWLARDPKDLAFLDAYDGVLANSEYTREWIRRLWSRETDVLYPPIDVSRLTPTAERGRTVLTVGRFFAPGLGHAKRQLEMVGWFGDLARSGRLPGWTLHVVGGCEDSQLPYLEQVRRAAEGLPVELHPNASRGEVAELLSTASVFWSATGYGESAKHPWAAEHFGMTTVEAMAGGCVPVVIDRAGQKEIVRPDVDGYRWDSPAELLEATVRVGTDEALRARLSTSAQQRAQAFSDEAFAQRWVGIADRRALLG
ncbi:MAG TPA: glycosyltransferase [Frankiaceae bacterium]|nr:glycosyltransferase [Frankiaceae bacterium]